jgi:uncharacterized membrane protein
MDKTRLEIFSDAVIAIAMTLMVLELKVPEGNDWYALAPLSELFLAYILSYIYLGIYWNNHHHMLHATDHIDGRVMWANLHLLFWLSLVPFCTAWMAENHFSLVPVFIYGVVLLMAAVAYSILFSAIIAHSDANQDLREAIGDDRKGKISILFYLIALPVAFFNPWIALGIYVLIALMWLVPDRRIESKLGHRHV